MKQALIYSLKVWLTTIVLGMRVAAVIKICLDTDHLYGAGDIFSSAIYDIPVGLIACTPSFFLFLVGVFFLSKTSGTIWSKKLILSVLGVILAILPFAIVFTHQLFSANYLPDMLPELCGYVGITLAGIWFYKLTWVSNTPNAHPSLDSEL
jgi:uncharacterized membrane protein